jgi:L-ascorbate metabolism protein UlaG (beta-lactamase superfamily)
MTTLLRLSDSCLQISTNRHVTLIDPGFHTFDSGEVDLETIGDVTRVLITHEHTDHLKPEFVRWLVDRRRDVTVHGNQSVVDLLARHGIEASTSQPDGVTAEEAQHEMTPAGTVPPNRAFTVHEVLTHPGDSYRITSTAPVLALSVMSPWGSARESVEFARRMKPRQVVLVHDFYFGKSGRAWVARFIAGHLKNDGIEVLPLDWGESATL